MRWQDICLPFDMSIWCFRKDATPSASMTCSMSISNVETTCIIHSCMFHGPLLRTAGVHDRSCWHQSILPLTLYDGRPL